VTPRWIRKLESDNTGLQVIDNEWGRAIWYTKEKRENLDDKELKKLEEHASKFREKLFDEKAPEYIGISEGEFRSGGEILKNIDVFLNKKTCICQEKGEREGFFRQQVRSVHPSVDLAICRCLCRSMVDFTNCEHRPVQLHFCICGLWHFGPLRYPSAKQITSLKTRPLDSVVTAGQRWIGFPNGT